MDVRTRDGRIWRQAADHGRGSEHHPLSDDELVEKFRDQAGRVLSADAVDELVAIVMALEELDDVGRLAELVVPTGEGVA
jgi:hypothetical protein